MSFLNNLIPAFAMSCLFLSGCTAQRIETGSPDHMALLANDYNALYAPATGEQQEIALSLQDALDFAAAANLDSRVSALEVLSKDDDITLARLQALPQLSAKRSRLGRNNEGASSSRSVITGNQSLEPSFSSDRYRTVDELALNWDVIDIALAVAQSRIAKDEAQIAAQRHDKVMQTIARDVASSYWRAYAAQESREKTASLLSRTDEALSALDTAMRKKYLSASQSAEFRSALLEQARTLRAQDRELAAAEIELKSLLSLPQNTELFLTSKPDHSASEAQNLLQEDMDLLEFEALRQRPEITESVIQGNIDRQNTRNEILRSIPGANIFFSHNNDTNSFLQDDSWMSYSASIAQNVMALFTAPARIRTSQNREELGEARRLSLMAAVLTQLHLSRHALQTALDEENYASLAAQTAADQGRAASARKSIGTIGGPDALASELAAQNARIEALKAQALLQESLATLTMTLGRKPSNLSNAAEG
jgi:outer membrane protein, multidrug efflux system